MVAHKCPLHFAAWGHTCMTWVIDSEDLHRTKDAAGAGRRQVLHSLQLHGYIYFAGVHIALQRTSHPAQSPQSACSALLPKRLRGLYASAGPAILSQGHGKNVTDDAAYSLHLVANFRIDRD